MSPNLSPNFEPDDIVKSISEAIKAGQTNSIKASQGDDWESVIDVLDDAEHHIGKAVSYTHLTLPTIYSV